MIKYAQDRFFALFKFSDFAVHISTMVTGTALAQLINFAVSPLLTRLYSPAEQGILSVYLAVIFLVVPIACGTYDRAIVLPQKDDDARDLAALSFFILLVVSFLFLVFTLINKQLGLIKDLTQGPWLLIPFNIFLLGLYQIFQAWQTRKKNFARISLSKVGQSISTAVVNVSGGLLHLSSPGLIYGTFIGHATAVVISLADLRNGIADFAYDRIQDRLLQQAKRYVSFPRYNLLRVLTEVARESLTVFLISSFFTKELLGYFSLSFRVLRAPLTILGTSVAMVLYQKLASSINMKQPIFPIIKKLCLQMTLLIIPPFTILLIWGPEIFRFVFGDRWEMSGVFSQILIPWLLIDLYLTTLSNIPLVLNRQKTFFRISFCYNLSVIAAILVSALLYKDIIFTLTCLSAIGSLYLLGQTGWILSIAKRTERGIS